MAVQAHEVSINVAVEFVLGGWMEDGPFVDGPCQIVNDVLDCLCMAFLRSSGKVCHLTHSIGNVGMCVGG